jgi:hypothetical protein
MNKKLLLVLASNPALSTKYANIVVSGKITTKALCPPRGLAGFIESLSLHFGQAGGILLAVDTFVSLGVSPVEVVEAVLKAKPFLRVLVFRMGGMGDHSYSKLLEAGATSVYVGVVPNSGSFSHWVTENFFGTPSRMIHTEKISGRAPFFVIPSESLNDEEDVVLNDEKRHSRIKKSTASVKKKTEPRQKVAKKADRLPAPPSLVSVLLPHNSLAKEKIVVRSKTGPSKRR